MQMSKDGPNFPVYKTSNIGPLCSLLHLYRIPKYEGPSNETDSKCTKVYPKHQRFSPGLLVMTCQHQRCYGFEIMSSRESTIMVYNMLLKKFDTPPNIIIYDNACNLCTTCSMRYNTITYYYLYRVC